MSNLEWCISDTRAGNAAGRACTRSAPASGSPSIRIPWPRTSDDPGHDISRDASCPPPGTPSHTPGLDRRLRPVDRLAYALERVLTELDLAAAHPALLQIRELLVRQVEAREVLGPRRIADLLRDTKVFALFEVLDV